MQGELQMRRFRTALLCLVGAVGLVAAACAPTTPPTGLAPVAVVTATPESGAAPLEVQFSSAGSSDPDGTISSYSWNFGDGSPLETTADATHTYAVAGAYTATLTVKDNANLTKSASIQIDVIAVNAPPTATIVASPESGRVPLTVDFTGSGSVDPDGSVASYAWDFGDGTTSTDADPQHTYTTVGAKAVSLTVTDDEGATDTATTTIAVDPNLSPTAAASADPTSGKLPLAVQFSSAGSADPDGSIASYSWTFGDGATSALADPAHVYTTAGLFIAELTVTDDNGSTDTTTVDVQVNANQAPVAVAGSNISGGQAPLTVVFSSAGSTDADGGITGYSWDFGDGNSSASANPTYSYSTEGTYTATLTVTDAEGATDSASVVIDVDPIPNVPPTVVAGAGLTSQRVGLPISFSSAGTEDTDGFITSYLWDFGDGTSSTATNPSKTYVLAGTYTPTLTVTDNSGAVVTASTATITIDPNQAPTAAAAGTPTSGIEPLVVNFSSAGTGDADGSIVSHNWDFGDGSPDATTANASHTYTTPGTYEATLTVTDDFGTTDTATVTTVVNLNQVPVAAIGAGPQAGPRPLVVSFDGTSSVDPEAGPLTYAWNFGDGGSSTAAAPQHTYAVGTYTASLVVTDSGGKVSSPATVSITVYVDDDGDGAQPPSDCNDADPTTYPGAPDALDATGKDTNCDGVDGTLAATVFVQSPGGADSGSCGSLGSPCATIGQGVINASATGRTVVQVASGTYGAGFTLGGGITVRGGYSAGFVGRSGSTTVNSTVTVTAAPAGASLQDLSINGTNGGSATGVLVQGGSTVALTRLTVTSGTPSGAGASAYGVRAIGGSDVTLTDSTVTAAAGVPGSGGASSPAAAAGGCNGNTGADSSTRTTASCGGSGGQRSGEGGQGGGTNFFATNAGSAGAAGGVAGSVGGAGGAGGCGSSFGCGNHAGGGGSGTAGSAGASGAGASNATTAAGATWAGLSGSAGGSGTAGRGGGGGGGGASATAKGGDGGSGGAGGNGGTGSTSVGSAGGGSFAVYASDASVASQSSVLTANAGGSGGAGTTGGAGGKGGNGGNGGNKSCCEAGGGGGGGGAGGGGGGGGAGGGAGGPSIALFHRGTGTASVSGGVLSKATGGAGGAGGAGGSGGGVGSGGARGDCQLAGSACPSPGAQGGLGPNGNAGGSGAAGLALRIWDNGATTV